MNPYQLAIGQTVGVLSEVLRGRQRILEVGCGRGEVARRLGAAGFRITAIDLRLPEPSPSANVTFLERDFLTFEAPPFDAIVFTSSLHQPVAGPDSHAAEIERLVRSERVEPGECINPSCDVGLFAPTSASHASVASQSA